MAAYLTHAFSLQGRVQPWETSDSTLALHLGAISNSKVTDRKHKNVEKLVTKQTAEKILIYSM